MSEAAEPAAIRRIVVALDASGASRSAAEATVRLASVLGAELEGIFIEDANLLRLAGLPFLREVRAWSLAEETLSSKRMQRELRALARQAEKMLMQAVGETGVSWSFRVWRGRPEAESLMASFDADVLSLGRARTLAPYLMQADYGTRAQPARRMAASVSILFSESGQASRALFAACHLAKDLDVPVTVWLPKRKTEALADLQGKAGATLGSCPRQVCFAELTDSSVGTLARVVNASRSTVLIAAAGDPLLAQRGLDKCLESLACPLLLVR